jgi:hypothetical protein
MREAVPRRTYQPLCPFGWDFRPDGRWRRTTASKSHLPDAKAPGGGVLLTGHRRQSGEDGIDGILPKEGTRWIHTTVKGILARKLSRRRWPTLDRRRTRLLYEPIPPDRKRFGSCSLMSKACGTRRWGTLATRGSVKSPTIGPEAIHKSLLGSLFTFGYSLCNR